MHLEAHRLAAALNALVGRHLDPGRAEHLLTASGQVHHVSDDTGIVGLGAGQATPLRVALGRVASTAAQTQVWQVISVRPGRTGGLRGPAGVTRLAVEHGAIVLPVGGGPAWVPLVLGTPDEVRAVQWLVVVANPPLSAPTPAEAQAALQQAMSAAEQGIRDSTPTPEEPARLPDLELPPGYPPASQRLLTTALRMSAAADWARERAAGLSSFDLTASEHLLSELSAAAVAAADACVSWPQRALVE